MYRTAVRAVWDSGSPVRTARASRPRPTRYALRSPLDIRNTRRGGNGLTNIASIFSRPDRRPDRTRCCNTQQHANRLRACPEPARCPRGTTRRVNMPDHTLFQERAGAGKRAKEKADPPWDPPRDPGCRRRPARARSGATPHPRPQRRQDPAGEHPGSCRGIGACCPCAHTHQQHRRQTHSKFISHANYAVSSPRYTVVLRTCG